MSLFPPTSLTLLQKLAVEVTGGNEASWVRFFDLYTPAIRRFVEWNDHAHDPDDVVQEVYLKLVDAIRNGKYNPDKARFRTFLALLSWAKAKHEAAVEHVLTKVAMEAQSRDIYRAYVLENRTVEDVSTAFDVSSDIIYKVKNRVNKIKISAGDLPVPCV